MHFWLWLLDWMQGELLTLTNLENDIKAVEKKSQSKTHPGLCCCARASCWCCWLCWVWDCWVSISWESSVVTTMSIILLVIWSSCSITCWPVRGKLEWLDWGELTGSINNLLVTTIQLLHILFYRKKDLKYWNTLCIWSKWSKSFSC